MTVKDALNKRHSIRAFLPKHIEKNILVDILMSAVRTPSWANSQPWEIFIAQGDTLNRIKKGYLESYANGTPTTTDIPRPSEWTEAAKERQKQLRPDMVRDCGEDVSQFGSLNQEMFHAPAVIYICMDKRLSSWSLYDIGAYSQSLMLSAIEHDLGTIPAVTLTHFPQILRKELQIPEHFHITIGIAIGYIDTKNGINRFISGRSPIEETVRFFD